MNHYEIQTEDTATKKNTTFEQWKKLLDKVAVQNGYEPILAPLVFELEVWMNLYDKGLTPAKAWRKI